VTVAAGTPLHCVDAFTAEPFAGNPAAVCLLDTPLDELRMQAIAAELNLSETAFVVRGGDELGLRWFTPTQEVELCGHATLASAHVLFETDDANGNDLRFRTRWKGVLTATRTDDGIALDLPAAVSTTIDAPAGLAAALGADPVAVGVNDLHHVVELADARAVAALSPDFDALAAVDEVEAVAVTARAGDDRALEGVDFVSRYFAPKHGITEDPVTGSAHTSVGPWWAERLGTSQLTGKQLSARTGIVRVRVGDPTPERVTLVGDAVTVWSGELLA
jgi:PhzF family phenazine biosynthesis protein